MIMFRSSTNIWAHATNHASLEICLSRLPSAQPHPLQPLFLQKTTNQTFAMLPFFMERKLNSRSRLPRKTALAADHSLTPRAKAGRQAAKEVPSTRVELVTCG